MAVVAGTVNVNSDQTGWTSSDVFDALETVFANMGFHGGTAKTGVPVCTKWPGQTDNEPALSPANNILTSYPTNLSWEHAGGYQLPYNGNRAERKFEVTANGTSGYYMQETWQPTNINTTSNTLTVPYNDVLTTGTELVFIPTGGTSDNEIGGLTLNTSYYVIRVSGTEIKLASNLTDANNATELNLTGAPNNGWGSTTRFWKPQAGSNNVTIETYQGDTLSFNVDATGLNICDGTSYAGNKTLTSDNGAAGNLPYAVNSSGYISNIGTTSFTWYTGYWIQSENNDDIESFEKPDTFIQGNVTQTNIALTNSGRAGLTPDGGSKVVEYCYASANTSAMKGTIILKPKYSAYSTYWHPYWKVTVAGDGAGVTGGGGAGKDLKLRVMRWDSDSSTSYRGRIANIYVTNSTDGWNSGATFTIPGADVGGQFETTPSDYDIEFGTNTAPTTDTSGDGICSLVCTDYGATSSFFQKSANGHYAVLKKRQADDKKYGDSYYVFYIDRATPYRMCVMSGAYWETQNSLGTSANPTNQYFDDISYCGFYGFMDGLFGNNAGGMVTIDPNNTNYNYRQNFCSASTPDQYRLRIKYWRPQSPQDESFGVIQFVQVINDKIEDYFTFSLAPSSYGVTSPGVDLDYLYHGHIVTYHPSDEGSNNLRGVQLRMSIPNYDNNSGSHPYGNSNLETIGTYTRTGDSSYGWLRNYGGPGYPTSDNWVANIQTANYEPDYNIVTYYRNADYDGISGLMDYYRPIKGIPLLNAFAPCPYYLPDHFAMIQVGTAPGLTEFRSGDTITVSGGEVWTVITPSVQASQTGLDGVTGGSAIGMLFCARTT